MIFKILNISDIYYDIYHDIYQVIYIIPTLELINKSAVMASRRIKPV